MVDKNKTTGYIVFALGIALLLVTFYLAIHTYLNPDFIQGFSDLVETDNGDFAPFIGFLIYLVPPFFLFVMGSVAAKITKYGIQMIKSPEKKIESRRKARTSSQPKRTTSQNTKTDKERSTSPSQPKKQEQQQPPDQQKQSTPENEQDIN